MAPAWTITYPDDLPISQRRDELVDVLTHNQVVIVAGETGSGKSTQLPKLCLEAGRGSAGMIAHTQPRRVAARTIAARVASELGVDLGAEVGFSVRFDDQVGERTVIRSMTDGIMLAELGRDPDLSRYDTVIVDEAHERSLNVDVLLGYLAQLLPRRPDLHVVVTSATIDTDRFAAHFARDGVPAPVVVVEGRTYPVEVRYRPPDDGADPVTAVLDAVDEAMAAVDGDVLVFCSGEREIHDIADALRGRLRPGVEVLAMYARLSSAEQQRVFAAHDNRRVVLATNIAETSITVPGVRSVVDTGTVRISRYSKRLRVQRLPIEPVSQASAAQRAGRCGRVAPGVCIRLYSEQDFAERPAFTEPEIQRTNLASVVLLMASLGLGDVRKFPFVDPPDTSTISGAVDTLTELGAVRNGDGPVRLTRLGRHLARLPIDPRLGRMILDADRHGCVREVLVIASALSIQDVRERPRDATEAAAAAHRRFDVPGSDLMSVVALWDYLEAQRRELSGNAFRRMCRDEYLNWLRVREWRDLYTQLRRVAGTLGVRPGADSGHPDRVHECVLAGLLGNIGHRDDDGRTYAGVRGSRFEIARGSVLSRRGPRWVMAAELVETDRLRARRCATIRPEWVERLAGDLARRSYGEPEWDSEQGRAVTTESVTFRGLTLVSGRRVSLERVDPVAARQVLIVEALVRGHLDDRARDRLGFIAHNDAVIDELIELGERRRRDLTPSEPALVEFWSARLPASITSQRALERWWRDIADDDPSVAYLDTDLAVAAALREGAADLPGLWHDIDGSAYDITYLHDPDSPLDGVTVHVPLARVNAFTGAHLDWSVPAHRPEMARVLFRTLPKALRTRLIPANDTIDAALNVLGQPNGTPFVAAFAQALSEVSTTRVRPDDMDPSALPVGLRVHVVVSDDHGEVHAVGDDWAVVRDIARPAARQVLAAAAPLRERTGITTWDVGDLPEVIEWSDSTGTMRAHPTLLDRGESVSLRLVTDPALQRRLMHDGVIRLVLLTTGQRRREVLRRLGDADHLALSLVGTGPDALLDDVATATVARFIDEDGLVFTANAFEALCDRMRTEGAQIAVDIVDSAMHIVHVAADVHRRLEALRAPAAATTVADASSHLSRLVGPGFVARAGSRRLGDVHRYVRGVDYRLDQLGGRLERDRSRIAEVTPLEERYAKLRARARTDDSITVDLDEVGWLLEELRMSLFAQPVGVNAQVSTSRIRRLLG